MHILGQYRDGDSIVHLLDPRAKVLGTILISFLVLGAASLPLCSLTIFLLLVFRISRLPLRTLYGGLRSMAFFLALLFLLQILETEGTPVIPVSAWGVMITHEGLLKGAVVTWRFALLLAWAVVLTATTSPSEMVVGLERFLRPFRILKVDSQAIAIMVSTAMRFVPVMAEEIHRVRLARLARGGDLRRGSFLSRARSISSLLLPLLLGIFRRADRLALAIEARGYAGGPRTCMRELRFSTRDFTALGVIAMVGALCQML